MIGGDAQHATRVKAKNARVLPGCLCAFVLRIGSRFPIPLDRSGRAVGDRLNELIRADAKVTIEWGSAEKLPARPELVKPPKSFGRVRLLRIDSVDLQACGGTHVANVSAIGTVIVTRFEGTGRQNRRVGVAVA